MKILLIEDHPLKQARITTFIRDHFPSIDVVVRNSYISGLKELINSFDNYHLLLLDISMPNYDISSADGGGDWMPLAGKNILKEMYIRDIPTKVIVITMHGSFEDGTKLIELHNTLLSEFSENYIGYVHYSQGQDDWKTDLVRLLKENIS